MDKQHELWQSLLQELGLSRQEASAWQQYVIEIPREIDPLRKDAGMKGEFIEESLGGPLILRLAGRPSPCQFQPLTGVSRDPFHLEKEDCQNVGKADNVYGYWLAFEDSGNPLNAADYNNIGCAVMWKKPPDETLARDMFDRALKKGGSGLDTVRRNRQLLQQPKPLVVTRDAFYRVLADEAFSSLWRPKDDATILGPWE